MKQKKRIFLIITFFIIGMFLYNPICKGNSSWNVENTSISNTVVRDGRLTAFDFEFEVPSYLGETQSWIGIQKEKFEDSDLTDRGNIYGRFANISKLKRDDDFLFQYKIKQFSKNSFPCFGEEHSKIHETLSEVNIDADETGVYYIYLWTLYDGSFYPDILLATVNFADGNVVVSDSNGEEMLNDTFENLEAPVVDKIEIVGTNLKIKVGEEPTFSAEIKNNPENFDFVETFMALNRESTISSDEESDEKLVKDYVYFHISDIYIKDNVNLKFDDSTKVYIDGVEYNSNNVYISQDWISISNEKDKIIPEGYIAPAFLDLKFEKEQARKLEATILESAKARKVKYNSDSVRDAVNAAFANGDSVEIILYISESITKSRMLYFFNEHVVDAINKNINGNNKFSAYYEIVISVWVDGSCIGEITELADPITVTIPYPNGVPNLADGYQRVWKLIRNHNDQIAILDATKTDNGISLTSDSFSVYALVFEDVKVDDSTNDESDSGTLKNQTKIDDSKNVIATQTEENKNPDTADNIAVWVGALVMSVLSISVAIRNKKNF